MLFRSPPQAPPVQPGPSQQCPPLRSCPGLCSLPAAPSVQSSRNTDWFQDKSDQYDFFLFDLGAVLALLEVLFPHFLNCRFRTMRWRKTCAQRGGRCVQCVAAVGVGRHMDSMSEKRQQSLSSGWPSSLPLSTSCTRTPHTTRIKIGRAHV